MIKQFDLVDLKKLYIPPLSSHKGQNGKLMIVGGSRLFHGASLWALKVASRIVDMVFYSSVPENNEIVNTAKLEFRDGIVVKRSQIESYIEEADCVLVGPGMVRSDKSEIRNPKSETNSNVQNINYINNIKDEGEQTYYLTKHLLSKYSYKKWVIDAGSLQMMELEWLKQLKGNVIITPHRKEFETLFGEESGIRNQESSKKESHNSLFMIDDSVVGEMAKKYNCVILLKGQTDIVCNPSQCVRIEGGNAGMTKGGSGDVLAGLVAALYCKNDTFLSACAASYINKKAGERLFERVGYYFNASDLADEIPKAMKELVVQ